MNREAGAARLLNQAEIASLARVKEDIIAGHLIARHSARVRLAHWLMAIFFFLSLATGFVIFTPFFAGLAAFFGGGQLARSLHPWFSLGFLLAMLFLFRYWRIAMRSEPGDEEWRKNFGAYMRYEAELQNVGKYNAGQKLYFWSVWWGALALLASGIVMWIPTSFPFFIRALSYWLHDLTFFAFVIGIIYHVYLSTTAMPGTFRAMTRGTVTRDWARWHHPRWYRDITGAKD